MPQPTLLDQVRAGLVQGAQQPLTSARYVIATLPAASAALMGGSYDDALERGRSGQGLEGLLSDPTLYLGAGAGAVDAAATGAEGFGAALARAMSDNPKPVPTRVVAPADYTVRPPQEALEHLRAMTPTHLRDFSPYDLDP